MKAYRRFQAGVVLFAVVYPVLSGAITAAIGRELFPVFAWTLFCRVPNEIREYAVRILEIDGQELAPVRRFQESAHRFPQAHSIEAFWTIKAMGEAAERGDDRLLETKRAFFEVAFLGRGSRVRYELVVETYDPLDRVHQGTPGEVRSLRVFQYEGVGP
jgi:hypothetical protein